MNLRTSPPLASTASHNIRISISSSRGELSERLVNPRKSESQITALMVSPMPRRIWPARTRPPDSATDRGVEERSRHAPQGLDLKIDCDGGHHRREQCDFVVGETVDPGRGERKGLVGSVAERHRQDDVVSDAGVTQLDSGVLLKHAAKLSRKLFASAI